MSLVDLDDNTPRRRCSYDRMRVSNLHGLLSSSLKRAPKQLRQKTYPARFQYVHGNVFPINKGTGVSVSPGDNKKCRSREVADYLYTTSSKKASHPHGRSVAAVRTASAAAYSFAIAAAVLTPCSAALVCLLPTNRWPGRLLCSPALRCYFAGERVPIDPTTCHLRDCAFMFRLLIQVYFWILGRVLTRKLYLKILSGQTKELISL